MDYSIKTIVRILVCIFIGIFISAESAAIKSIIPSSAPIDVANKIQDLKNKTAISLADMDLSQVAPLVSKNMLGSKVTNLKLPKITKLPAQVKSSDGLILEGNISFNGKSVPCSLLFAQMIDSAGIKTIGYSVTITLPKDLKIADFSFLTELGVKQTDLDLFKVDFPAASLVISNLPNYLDNALGAVIQPGVMVITRTSVPTFVAMVKQDIAWRAGGDLSKLSFLDKIAVDSSLLFSLIMRFKDKTLEQFNAALSIPMQTSLDIAQIRKNSAAFKPVLGAPFTAAHNTQLRNIVSAITQNPMSLAAKITVDNFVAKLVPQEGVVSIESNANLMVTRNDGAVYIYTSRVGITPENIAIELPRITTYSLGIATGISVDDVAVAAVSNYKFFATGVPFSILGLIGSTAFAFNMNSVRVEISGAFENDGDFFVMGVLPRMSEQSKTAFNAQAFESIAKKVGFDARKLVAALKNMPVIAVTNCRIYASTKTVTRGIKKYGIGMGGEYAIQIQTSDGVMIVSGNASALSFSGFLAKMDFKDVVMAGKDSDTSMIIAFDIHATSKEKPVFSIEAVVEVPKINLRGQGTVILESLRVKGGFQALLFDGATADFTMDFDPRNSAAFSLPFAMTSEGNQEFIMLIMKDMLGKFDSAVKNLSSKYKAAAQQIRAVLIDPLSAIEMPENITGSIAMRAMTGQLSINGGAIALPVIGKLDFTTKINVDFKVYAKTISSLSSTWVNKIKNDLMAAIDQ